MCTVHSRFQEISGAYVHNFTFKNFNPFLEGRSRRLYLFPDQ